MRGSKQASTSWQVASHWYDAAVGEKGHYYHEHVVMPGVLRLLRLDTGSHVLDVACGQGVLARALPGTVRYTGLDISSSLLKAAQHRDQNPLHTYRQHDVTKPFNMHDPATHAVLVLSLQNIACPGRVLQNTSAALTPGGYLLIVLNHPCFRIPRQSSWGIDPQNNLEYRRLNRYLSPLRIPITLHPGDSRSPHTWSYHLPLSAYFSLLKDTGFVITELEEWTSDKHSVGAAASRENRSRREFPLFLALLAEKRT